MKTLAEHLSQYAAYHRDGRNIATHFVGIPMIVMAVSVLLSHPAMEVAGMALSLSLVLALVFSAFYVSLDLRLGMLMSLLMALAVAFGKWSAQLPTEEWLGIGVGGFVVGWAFQFAGHFYEGRKPAFVDDLIGLAVGPLFVVTETLFLLGLLPDLKAKIEGSAGRIRWGRPASP